MNKVVLYTLGMLLLLTACGKDDEYYYPSVRLEFVTIKADGDGHITELLPDKGDWQSVSNDRTHSSIAANDTRRALSNYEVLADGTVQIYSLQAVVAPEPKLASDLTFKDGLKHDPADIISIWIGRDYLNIILNIKTGINTGKVHIFGMVEESVSSSATAKEVTLSLYHNADNAPENYNRRAYLSVPLAKYIEDTTIPHPPLQIKFKYYTRDKDGELKEKERVVAE